MQEDGLMGQRLVYDVFQGSGKEVWEFTITQYLIERAVSLLIREKSWVRKTRKQENTKMKGLEKEP